ncbi:SubName: Full=Uncharacterized protein {ECO:0000313/EMBL:CCA77551.1} [Serendipita indica DSM 11827]|nr:SubName: Full=Uncharacterized protein {ECO:0000313/EMBL:CCA77551.1} [Serendipita indica DSM 11827]
MASRIVQYVSVAGAVAYYYDYLLTVDEERLFFWKIGGGWIVRTIFVIVSNWSKSHILAAIMLIDAISTRNWPATGPISAKPVDGDISKLA